MNHNITDNIRKVAFALISLLVALLIYCSYLQVIKGEFLQAHPLNRRTDEIARQTERGKILDRQGEVLAYSERDVGKNVYVRDYPYGAVCAHVTGYDSLEHGMVGLEAVYNGYLSGVHNPTRRLGVISNIWKNEPGSTIHTTIDIKLQKAAFKALGNQRGAVVALSPRTGAILVMVSKPTFDPNEIDNQWKSVSGQADSPLLNRGVQGLYPPGSILKIMIAEAALSEGATTEQSTYKCEGLLRIGPDYTLSEAGQRAHGNVKLEDALALSCNVTFGSLALALGRERMSRTYERFGFNKSTGDELHEVSSHIPDFKKMTEGDLAQSGIGQGSLLVTPLRMAMLASVFANKGVMMQPYLVSKITTFDGGIIKKFEPQQWLAPSNQQVAQTVGKMMASVVKRGTGYSAQIKGITVAGKTGTAENPHGKPHAWFVGFAPVENPKIAIAVIVENAGAGGDVAAPIARHVFEQTLR